MLAMCIEIFQFMCFSLIEFTSEDSMIIESIFVSVTSAVYYALDTCWINWKVTNPWTIIGQGTISNWNMQMSKTHRGREKMVTICCRWHFQMHFIQRKCFNSNFTEFVFRVELTLSQNSMLCLVQVMVWHHTRDKLLWNQWWHSSMI